MKETKRHLIVKSLLYSDLPMLCFVGMGLAFLLIGVFFLTIEAFCDFIWEYTVSWKDILAGIVGVGLSLCMGGIAALYWWLVPRKSGVLFPSMNGFGFVIVVASMFSAVLIYVELLGYLRLM